MLATPNLVTVTFAGDTMRSDLESFGGSLLSSTWWNVARAGDCEAPGGPCVGVGAAASVAIATPAAAAYSDSAQGAPSTLQQWLATAISTGQLPAPDPGPISDTVYVLYLPQTTTVTLDGVESCAPNGFAGYHNWLQNGSQQVPYTVVDECAEEPADGGAGGATVLQNTTLTASHEVLEAATDPVPPTGYALDPSNVENWGWIDVTGGGELADMCVDLLGLNQDWATDGSFVVQRIWSIARAAAGVDPCVPVPAGTGYFNAAPRQSFFVIDVGGSATFEVDAFSYQPMADWWLTAFDGSDSMQTYLSFSIEGSEATSAGPLLQVHSGSTVQATVTLTMDPGSLDTGEADGLIVSFTGDPAAPTAAHYWPIAVMSPADAQDAGVPLGARPHGVGRESRRLRRLP